MSSLYTYILGPGEMIRDERDRVLCFLFINSLVTEVIT